MVSPGPKYTGTFQCLSSIIKAEGVSPLLRLTVNKSTNQQINKSSNQQINKSTN
jgi:hypothetical protein